MALLQQVLGGDISAGFILQADAAGLGVFHIAVDQHIGNAQAAGGTEEVILEHAGEDQAGKSPAAAERIQLRRVLHGADHQVVSFLPHALLDAVHKGTHEGVADRAAGVLGGDMRNDANDVGLVIGQGTGRHAGGVVLPRDDFLDFCHHLR